MKTLITMLALCVSIASFATSIVIEENAILVELDLDENFAKNRGLENATIAMVTVDYKNYEVTLTIEKPFSCPDGEFCAMVMPEPEVITLPIISRSIDGCNFIDIVAEIDDIKSDGIKETIEVTDYSRGYCEIPVYSMITVVHTEAWIDRSTSEYVQNISRMYGDEGLE